jgi:hypothetical protein
LNAGLLDRDRERKRVGNEEKRSGGRKWGENN